VAVPETDYPITQSRQARQLARPAEVATGRLPLYDALSTRRRRFAEFHQDFILREFGLGANRSPPANI